MGIFVLLYIHMTRMIGEGIGGLSEYGIGELEMIELEIWIE